MDGFQRWLRAQDGYEVVDRSHGYVAVEVVEGRGDGFMPAFWEKARENGYQPELVNTVAEYAELRQGRSAAGGGFGLNL